MIAGEKITEISLNFNSSLLSELIFKKPINLTKVVCDDFIIKVQTTFRNKNIPQDIIGIDDHTIIWSYFESALGTVASFFHNEMLIGLEICADASIEIPFNKTKAIWRHFTFLESTRKVKELWHKVIFTNKEINVTASGSPFQIAVWNELLTMSPGETRNYIDIASSLNIPSSVRSVGTAIGQNPIFLFIPCHRVVRKSGEIGGYRWGSDLKRKLLNHELLLNSLDQNNLTSN